MCGIAGIYHYAEDRRVDSAVLGQMTDALEHRGPDGRGLFVEGSIGLGHRRLSIVDLSQNAAQPMQSADARYVLSFNGEIYNHTDFRTALSHDGVRFRSHSDTETILELFSSGGVDQANQLAGIFAFAFWDKREKQLSLVRDPVGVKQLYYWDSGSTVIFASEIKALLHFPDVRVELDTQAVSEYLHFHTPIGSRTFFKNVNVLQPGEIVTFGPRGKQSRRFEFENGEDTVPFKTVQQASEALLARLGSTVKSQLMADVPVACFVSGGIDSSVVARYTRDFDSRKLLGFGCYFGEGGSLDEEPYAREVARALEIELRVVRPRGEDFVSTFEQALFYQDEPKIGAAMVSMWHVARLAGSSVKVCLGGQASDEFFGGYSRYAVAQPLTVLSRELRRRALGPKTAVGSTLQKQIQRRGTLSRLLELTSSVFSPWESRFFDVVASIPELAIAGAMPEIAVNHTREHAYQQFCDWVARSPDKAPIDRAMYWDQTVYLPGLFAQDDRMSMAHSLETRVPLADPRMVRLARRIPNKWKLNGFSTKWILKQTLDGVVPQTIINRPKAGFDTPFGLWAQGVAKREIDDLLSGPRTRQRGLFDTQYLARLTSQPLSPRDEILVWKLANIEMWQRIFADQLGERRLVNKRRSEELLPVRPSST